MGDPRYQFLRLDERFPAVWIPLKIITLLFPHAGRPTDKQHALIGSFVDLHETQNEDVGVAANNTFDCNIPKLPLGVGSELVVLGLDQVEDDVGCEFPLSSVIAEPLPAALDNRVGVGNATICAGVCGPLLGAGVVG